MNYHFTKKPEIESFVKEDEYIPLEVVIRDVDLTKHIGFYYGSTDLAEFCLDIKTGEICKFVLSFANNYTFIAEDMPIPSAENGEIRLFCSSRTDCISFHVYVFNDAVKISFSDNAASNYYRSGNLYVGFDSNDLISEIIVSNLTSHQINFTKNELELG